MKKPGIPSAENATDRAVGRALGAIKQNLDVITGAAGGEVAQLPSSATLADVINTVNDIIRRINRSGA